MAFVLLIIGITLLIAGVQNTQGTLFDLLKKDFGQFLVWFIAIFLIGALGYVEKLKPLSTAFMGLVILVLFLSKGKGFFPQFTSAISSASANSGTTQSPQATNTGAASVNPLPSLRSLGTLLTNSGAIQ